MNGLILVSGIIASLLWLYIVVNDDVIPYEWTSQKENTIYGLTFLTSCTVILGITYTLINQ